ncbi:MAG: DUF3572 domain-containing protein [Pseudomonadota bacterium]
MLRPDPLPDPETVALMALGFIAGNDALLSRFLALSGLELAEIKARIEDPALHAGLLDFLLAHEPDLLAFADHAGLPATAIAAARRKLPGAAPAS